MIGLRIENDVSTIRALQPTLNANSRNSKFVERLHGRFNAVGVTGGFQKHLREKDRQTADKRIPNAKKRITDYRQLYERNQQDLEKDAKRLQELKEKLAEVKRQKELRRQRELSRQQRKVEYIAARIIQNSIKRWFYRHRQHACIILLSFLRASAIKQAITATAWASGVLRRFFGRIISKRRYVRKKRKAIALFAVEEAINTARNTIYQRILAYRLSQMTEENISKKKGRITDDSDGDSFFVTTAQFPPNSKAPNIMSDKVSSSISSNSSAIKLKDPTSSPKTSLRDKMILKTPKSVSRKVLTYPTDHDSDSVTKNDANDSNNHNKHQNKSAIAADRKIYQVIVTGSGKTIVPPEIGWKQNMKIETKQHEADASHDDTKRTDPQKIHGFVYKSSSIGKIPIDKPNRQASLKRSESRHSHDHTRVTPTKIEHSKMKITHTGSMQSIPDQGKPIDHREGDAVSDDAVDSTESPIEYTTEESNEARTRAGTDTSNVMIEKHIVPIRELRSVSVPVLSPSAAAKLRRENGPNTSPAHAGRTKATNNIQPNRTTPTNETTRINNASNGQKPGKDLIPSQSSGSASTMQPLRGSNSVSRQRNNVKSSNSKSEENSLTDRAQSTTNQRQVASSHRPSGPSDSNSIQSNSQRPKDKATGHVSFDNEVHDERRTQRRTSTGISSLDVINAALGLKQRRKSSDSTSRRRSSIDQSTHSKSSASSTIAKDKSVVSSQDSSSTDNISSLIMPLDQILAINDQTASKLKTPGRLDMLVRDASKALLSFHPNTADQTVLTTVLPTSTPNPVQAAKERIKKEKKKILDMEMSQQLAKMTSIAAEEEKRLKHQQALEAVRRRVQQRQKQIYEEKIKQQQIQEEKESQKEQVAKLAQESLARAATYTSKRHLLRNETVSKAKKPSKKKAAATQDSETNPSTLIASSNMSNHSPRSPNRQDSPRKRIGLEDNDLSLQQLLNEDQSSPLSMRYSQIKASHENAAASKQLSTPWDDESTNDIDIAIVMNRVHPATASDTISGRNTAKDHSFEAKINDTRVSTKNGLRIDVASEAMGSAHSKRQDDSTTYFNSYINFLRSSANKPDKEESNEPKKGKTNAKKGKTKKSSKFAIDANKSATSQLMAFAKKRKMKQEELRLGKKSHPLLGKNISKYSDNSVYGDTSSNDISSGLLEMLERAKRKLTIDAKLGNKNPSNRNDNIPILYSGIATPPALNAKAKGYAYSSSLITQKIDPATNQITRGIAIDTDLIQTEKAEEEDQYIDGHIKRKNSSNAIHPSQLFQSGYLPSSKLTLKEFDKEVQSKLSKPALPPATTTSNLKHPNNKAEAIGSQSAANNLHKNEEKRSMSSSINKDLNSFHQSSEYHGDNDDLDEVLYESQGHYEYDLSHQDLVTEDDALNAVEDELNAECDALMQRISARLYLATQDQEDDLNNHENESSTQNESNPSNKQSSGSNTNSNYEKAMTDNNNVDQSKAAALYGFIPTNGDSFSSRHIHRMNSDEDRPNISSRSNSCMILPSLQEIPTNSITGNGAIVKNMNKIDHMNLGIAVTSSRGPSPVLLDDETSPDERVVVMDEKAATDDDIIANMAQMLLRQWDAEDSGKLKINVQPMDEESEDSGSDSYSLSGDSSDDSLSDIDSMMV